MKELLETVIYSLFIVRVTFNFHTTKKLLHHFLDSNTDLTLSSLGL